MVGPSGSGKSTRAKQILDRLEKDKVNAVIISRDKLREMMFGYTESNVSDYYKRETIQQDEWSVTQLQHNLVKQYLAENYVVIIDNTHLKEKYLTDLQKYGVQIQYHVMEEEKVDCIMNDEDRVRRVGKEVIDTQFIQFRELKRHFSFEVFNPEPVPALYNDNDPTKPDAIVFDIDGTLAHMDGRKPYEWLRVGEDWVDVPVREALYAHQKAGKKIIICTGRDGVCAPQTIQWLGDNDIAFDEIFIRPEKDNRPDWKVKQEMWTEIIKDYHIEAMYDDRDQVVNHARACGFKVYQVAEGNF